MIEVLSNPSTAAKDLSSYNILQKFEHLDVGRVMKIIKLFVIGTRSFVT